MDIWIYGHIYGHIYGQRRGLAGPNSILAKFYNGTKKKVVKTKPSPVTATGTATQGP